MSHIGTAKGGSTACLDIVNKNINYYSSYINGIHPLIGEYIQQVAVWKKSSPNQPKSVASSVMLEKYLSVSDSLLSDKEQSRAGYNFWRVIMKRTIGQNLHVGILNLKKNDITWHEGTDTDFSAWLDQSGTYNYSPASADFRYVIAKNR